MDYFFLAGIGAIAGVLAGLLGIGGGLVIVPLLVVVLGQLDFPATQIMRVAVATSLATILLTSLSSAYAHHRKGAVLWPVVWRLSIGLAAGALAASYLVDLLPHAWLKGAFVVFELLVAFQLYTGSKPKASRGLPRDGALVGAGGVFGALSGVLGIGGGTLIVPFLVWCNVGMRQAVATSSACGFFIAAAAVFGFVFLVEPSTALPPGTLGYLYLPALVMISLVSVLTAPLGVRFAHRLETQKLKRLFSIVLVVMAALLLWA